MLFLFDNLGFVWLFLILGAVRERHTLPALLERGDGMLFLFDNGEFSVYVSPLERGLRSVLWWDVRVRLRSFFEEVFVGFVWLLLILVAMRGRDTPLAPLERGGWNAVFSLIMNGL